MHIHLELSLLLVLYKNIFIILSQRDVVGGKYSLPDCPSYGLVHVLTPISSKPGCHFKWFLFSPTIFKSLLMMSSITFFSMYMTWRLWCNKLNSHYDRSKNIFFPYIDLSLHLFILLSHFKIIHQTI